MKTFAVIVPTAGYPEFERSNYAAMPNGQLASVISTPGYPYAKVNVYGSSLRESADKHAAEIPGAFVLEIHGPGAGRWPGDAEIVEALKVAGLVAYKISTKDLQAAVDEHARTQPARDAQWKACETQDDLIAVMDAEAAAMVPVREAFYQVTKGWNSRDMMQHIDIEYARKIGAIGEIEVKAKA